MWERESHCETAGLKCITRAHIARLAARLARTMTFEIDSVVAFPATVRLSLPPVAARAASPLRRSPMQTIFIHSRMQECAGAVPTQIYFSPRSLFRRISHERSAGRPPAEGTARERASAPHKSSNNNAVRMFVRNDFNLIFRLIPFREDFVNLLID